jgi:hypothetical protein
MCKKKNDKSSMYCNARPNHPAKRKNNQHRGLFQVNTHPNHNLPSQPVLNYAPILLTTPFTIFTIHVHTHPVCRLPLMIPNPTSAAQLNTNTTLNDAQNCPSVYSA